MENQLEQFKLLKQALLDYVLNAEGDLATALESFSANQITHWSHHKLPISKTDLAIDLFTTEGQINNQSILELFIHSQPHLSSADRALLHSWNRSFQGLFRVVEAKADSYYLINWLTDKYYEVKPNGLQREETLARLDSGEIIIARLSPVTETYWTFSGPLLLLGKLGKPKLAVAIGNFRNWFPSYLYGDAPELLEAAWQSVEIYHQNFVDFFGGDWVTLAGWALNQKLQDYQAMTMQKQFEKMGIDGSISLQELAAQAGISPTEAEDSLTDLGEDQKAVNRLFNSSKAIQMMIPSVQLPEGLRHAESVTVVVHPRWGQTFLKDYTEFVGLLNSSLSTPKAETLNSLDRLTLKYLQSDTVNVYLWTKLASEQPEFLEASLQRVLNNPKFDLKRDLEATLRQFGKPLTPPLPEIASVPLHLHNLFQEALQSVNHDSLQKKAKGHKKQKAGFGV